MFIHLLITYRNIRDTVVWKSESNVWGLVLSSHHVGSENSTQVKVWPLDPFPITLFYRSPHTFTLFPLLPVPASSQVSSQRSRLLASVLLLLCGPLYLTRADVLGMSGKLCAEHENSPVATPLTMPSSLQAIPQCIWFPLCGAPPLSTAQCLPVWSCTDPLQAKTAAVLSLVAAMMCL